MTNMYPVSPDTLTFKDLLFPLETRNSRVKKEMRYYYFSFPTMFISI